MGKGSRPPPGGNPSVRLDAGQLPLHRGAIRPLRRLMEKKREDGAGFGGRAKRTWSMSVSEETAQCASMEVAKRLEVERFGLPNKPSETPEQLEEPVRCGDGG